MTHSKKSRPQFGLSTALMAPVLVAIFLAVELNISTRALAIPMLAILIGVLGAVLFGRRGRSIFWGSMTSATGAGFVLGLIHGTIAYYQVEKSVRVASHLQETILSTFTGAILAAPIGVIVGWVMTSLVHHEGKMFWSTEENRQTTGEPGNRP